MLYYENLTAEHVANQFLGMVQSDFSACLRMIHMTVFSGQHPM